MKQKTIKYLITISCFLEFLLFPSMAMKKALADFLINNNDRFMNYGDLRLRYENDWSSKKSSGAKRDNRQRMCIRARLGVNASFTNTLSGGIRLRTGSWGSQQSPHITIVDLSSDVKGHHNVVLDKWYVNKNNDSKNFWIGRNDFPFWKHNELFWDDDSTPIGLAFSIRPIINSNFKIKTAAFLLPDGMKDFHGQLLAIQGIHKRIFQKNELHGAFGYFNFLGADGKTENLRNGNGNRDYHIMVANFRWINNYTTSPLTFGIDFMQNLKNYSAQDLDSFTANNANRITGFDFHFTIGKLQKRKSWLTALTFARIETLSVNASFAQDDWMRWGSADQTDGSDFKGYELRAGYMLSDDIGILARYYDVEAISNIQDGRRFRLDLNYKF